MEISKPIFERIYTNVSAPIAEAPIQRKKLEFIGYGVGRLGAGGSGEGYKLPKGFGEAVATVDGSAEGYAELWTVFSNLFSDPIITDESPEDYTPFFEIEDIS